MLEVWKYTQDHPDQAMAAVMATEFLMTNAKAASVYAVTAIANLMKLAKHTKKQPYSTKIDGNSSSIIVTNCDNVSITVPISTLPIYEDRKMLAELSKIVKPLRENKIDNAVFKAEDSGSIVTEEAVVYTEKEYFDVDDKSITSTRELWLTGKFNSLTKSTNNGRFILSDGSSVSYTFVGDNPQQMYGFFAYNGLVKVKCIAHLDENLNPTRIEILNAEKLEPELFDEQENKEELS
ncbi:MAG: hypothetical protein KatS3mg087_1279 [Patescibacteria group bacterium]|nr:MAG: hypothetical protein KatS3mg087_1279 [Patescibacteria group bacterium]